MTMSTFKMDRTCSFYGRELGREAKSCPLRSSGQCSYRQINRDSGKTIALLFFGIVFTLFGIFGTTSLIRQGEFGGIFIGLVFIIFGLAMATGRTKIYYSSEDGTTWKQRSFLFFELESELIIKDELETVDLELDSRLTYPASIVELSRLQPEKPIMADWNANMAEAVAIFKIAIISLIARNLVQIIRQRTYKSYLSLALRRVEDSYGLNQTAKVAEEYLGELEGKILSVLGSRNSQAEVKEWMDIAPIDKLVWSVYSHSVFPPGQWTIDLVVKDAVSQGWATYEGRFRKKFQPVQDSIIAQQKYVADLFSQLEEKQPVLSKALDVQIEKGIRSRNDPD